MVTTKKFKKKKKKKTQSQFFTPANKRLKTEPRNGKKKNTKKSLKNKPQVGCLLREKKKIEKINWDFTLLLGKEQALQEEKEKISKQKQGN